MEYGQEVELVNLQPGDVLFRNGKWEKVKEKDRNGVSHVAIYLGDGKIIHAEDHHRVDGEWVKYPQEEQKVRIDPLELITEDPHFIKATRLVEDLEDYIAVTVPWWRTDIRIEEDIFEEIGRIYGYRNFPLTVLKGALPKFEQNKSFALTNDIKTFLSGAGFTEVYNYSFISEGTLKKLGEKPEEVLEIENPLSPEYKYMRKELAGNLLNNLAKNQNEFERIAIFEIGTTFVPQKDLPKETKMLGIAVKNKSGMDGKTFYDLKGAVDFLFQKLNISDYFYRKEKIERMDGNRAVSIFVEGKKVGFLGEFSVQTENNFDLNSDSGICEINLDELLKHGSKVKEYSEISKFPKIIRDVSAIFGTGVEAGKLVAETAKLDKLIGRVEVIDIYQGKPLEKGERSITVRFEFQSMEKTLTDAEVDAIIIKINKKVSNLGGKIRGGEQS
jgi:phenylalanyl-tRNA synthetase beta chain